MTLYYPPTSDFIQKNLDAQLAAGATSSATLNNTTALQNKPGVMIIDRIDANGVETPTKVEVIPYTATSGATVTELTRGAAGTSDQMHEVGAIVEFGPDIVWAQGIIDTMLVEHNADGTHGDITADSVTTQSILTDELGMNSNPIENVADPTNDQDAATKKYVDNSIDNIPVNMDSWVDDTDRTWNYASATSFTISGIDLTVQFPRGTKLKLKQGGDYKYFYVISSSFSTDTTVNITGGSDYSLANESITDNYYSYAETPTGFPDYFNYAANFGNVTEGSGVITAKFSMKGKLVHYHGSFTLAANSSISGVIEIPLPVNAISAINSLLRLLDATANSFTGQAFRSASNIVQIYAVNAASTYAAWAATSATVPFTWTTNDSFDWNFVYEIS